MLTKQEIPRFDRLHTVCFVGEKIIPGIKRFTVKRKLKKAIIQCLNFFDYYYLLNIKTDFDMLAVKTLLKMKKKYSEIKLIVLIDINEQKTKRFEEIYNKIIDNAQIIEYISRPNKEESDDEVKKYIIEMSSDCIMYIENDYSKEVRQLITVLNKGLKAIDLLRINTRF